MAPIVNPNGFPYNAGPPVVNGQDVTVDRFLKSPTYLPKTLENLGSQQFLADYLYRTTSANGGNLMYDVAMSQDLYIDIDAGRQPRSIEPGQSFPEVNFTALPTQVASVQKVGAQFHVTYEEQRRDQRDVVGRNLIRLNNTMVRMSDDRSIAILRGNAGIVKFNAASAWNGATPSFFNDVPLAISMVNRTELGYKADTAIASPATIAGIQMIKDIWQRLPRENTNYNPLLNSSVNGLFGLNWIESRRYPDGEVAIGQRGAVGAVGSEMAPYTRTVDEPLQELWTVMAARLEVTVITDPSSFVIIQAVNG